MRFACAPALFVKWGWQGLGSAPPTRLPTRPGPCPARPPALQPVPCGVEG